MANLKAVTFFSGSTFITGSDNKISSSIVVGKWEVDPDDASSIQFRIPSSSFGGSNDRIGFYVSGSGRVGIGTKDPETAFDVRDIGEDVDPRDRAAKTTMLKVARTTQQFETPVTASVVSASVSVETAIHYGGNIGTVYEDYIYLTPTDFNNLTDNASVTTAGEIEGNGAFIADNGARGTYHAQKIIPKGYKATHVMINGSSASDTFRVYSSSCDATTTLTVSSGNPNTEAALSPNVTGGNGVYVSVMWGSRGNTDVYGGYIKLAKS